MVKSLYDRILYLDSKYKQKITEDHSPAILLRVLELRWWGNGTSITQVFLGWCFCISVIERHFSMDFGVTNTMNFTRDTSSLSFV